MYKEKLAVISAILIICVCFSFFFLYPQIRTFLTLRNNVELMERLIFGKESRFAASTENLASIETLKEVLRDKRNNLPETEVHIKSIVFVSVLMAEHGLIEKEFTIGETQRVDDLNELIKTQIKLRGAGKYADVMEFLKTLESAGEFYVIEESTLSFAGTMESEIEITLIVSVFAEDMAT